MVTPIKTSNIRIPQEPFLDANGRPNRAWYIWLQSPDLVTANIANPLSVESGGTQVSEPPSNGQVLIGGQGSYQLNNLTPGAGVEVVNGDGSITIDNTGLLSFSAGTTGFTPSDVATGDVVLDGTLNVKNGGTGQTSYVNGELLIGNTTGNTLNKATLTAGANITITNGPGSITIASTGTAADQENQTATAGQTVFTLTTMTYVTGSNTLSVFIDGVNQQLGVAFTETNSTTVTFTEGLHVGAKVRFATA